MPGVFQKGTTCGGVDTAFVLSLPSSGVQRDQELPMGRAEVPTKKRESHSTFDTNDTKKSANNQKTAKRHQSMMKG